MNTYAGTTGLLRLACPWGSGVDRQHASCPRPTSRAACAPLALYPLLYPRPGDNGAEALGDGGFPRLYQLNRPDGCSEQVPGHGARATGTNRVDLTRLA